MEVNINQLQTIKEELKPFQAQLVAVSKTKSADIIREAYEGGQKSFGENYAQEMEEKYKELPKDIQWHFIGHLQSNKIKHIAPYVNLIHSIDSIKLLEEINKHGRKYNRLIGCLLQLYIAKEDTKFGLEFDEAKSILDWLITSNLKNVKVKGFMGMASNTKDEKLIKKEFKSLNDFYSATKKPYDLSILSMGMTSDYKIALACGSNMVRIGSAIFGERADVNS